MQQFFQSAFLQALGKAIADSIWQMGLLFLLYQLLVFMFRIKQASAKNFLSSLFALGGFAWFISGIIEHWKKQLNQTASLVIEDASINNILLSAFTKDNRWQLLFNWLEYKLNFILPYLSVAYLFVLLWFTTKLLIQLQAANSLHRKGITTANEDLQTFFEFLVESMGIKRTIQLVISRQIDIPATLGFLKPIVLLPAAAVAHLTPAQLEAVLLHELAHIKRNDYFWNLLLSVAETMLFFNPFALLLIGIARKERENSCDDHVMNFQQNAKVYAEALLNVEKARAKNPQLVMALGDNKQHLMDRVKRILNLPAEKNKISTRLLALVFFTILFAITGWMIKGSTHATASKENKSAKNETTYRNNAVYISPDAVLKKNDKAVSLRDEKRKITLEFKKELNKNDDLIVWNEEDGEQMKFDKVIFNDLPTEWIERFARSGMNVLPLPEMNEHSPDVFFHLEGDSVLLHSKRKGEEAEFYKKFEQMHELNQRKTAKPGTAPYVRLQQNWIKDSLLRKLKGYFPEGFVWNEKNPDWTFIYRVPVEDFYRQKQSQAADEIKQQKARLLYKRQKVENKNSKDSVSPEEKIKSRFRSTPAFAYMHDPEMDEEIRMTQENIQITVENNNVFLNGRTMVHIEPMQHQQPYPPKRLLKRLEIIRL